MPDVGRHLPPAHDIESQDVLIEGVASGFVITLEGPVGHRLGNLSLARKPHRIHPHG